MKQATVNYRVPPESAVYDLAVLAGIQRLVSLRITDVLEPECLPVSIWGSGDGKDWGEEPRFRFPQQFYGGMTPAAVGLRQLPEVKFVQARGEVDRWGRRLSAASFWLRGGDTGTTVGGSALRKEVLSDATRKH